MTGAPAIVRSEREQWLALRRELLTASDVAPALGMDERRGPLQVYLSKVHGIEAEEKVFMRRGRRFEGAIADEYQEQMGRVVVDLGAFVIQRHPDIPWLGATLDRVTFGSAQSPAPVEENSLPLTAMPVPLQIKLAIGSAHDWKDEPPTAYLIQVQAEMACYGAPWAALAGLVGPGPLAVSDHVRNDAFLAVALPKLEEFWQRVQRREPPEADALPGTTDAIKRVWSRDDGTTIALDHEALALADRWQGARGRTATFEHDAQELENKLRARIAAHSFGALPDGSYLTLTKTDVRAHTNTIKAHSYRALKRKWPRIQRRK